MMKKEKFDVMVVYSETTAKSARDTQYKGRLPFPRNGRCGAFNDSYSYLLSKCKKDGLRAAFTTSKDIIGPGTFKSYWTYDTAWKKHSENARSRVLFDKFTPSTRAQQHRLELMTSSRSVYTFSNKGIKNSFDNKLNTYKYFKEYAIPTVALANPSQRTIALAKRSLDTILDNHQYEMDVDDGYILKDQTGSGGFKIYKVDFDTVGSEDIMGYYTHDKHKKNLLSYILQPFIDCESGFQFGKHSGLIDLRLIFINKKIIQAYIRVAKPGNFKCNEHQGGDLIYIPLKMIPYAVRTMSKKIAQQLDKTVCLQHSLYALDFIQSNDGNLYFIEGNTRPGIDWDHSKKINEVRSKELIDVIVHELRLISKETRG